jgi:hypothetical protein
MIAMNLCYIHVSPLNRRLTTTQTSTHLIVLARCDHWLFGRRHYYFSSRSHTILLPPRAVNDFGILVQFDVWAPPWSAAAWRRFVIDHG